MHILRLLSFIALLGTMRGHAQDIATLTLLKDSALRIIRGVSVLQAVEGMRIRPGDFLETGAGASTQAQLEFAGGVIVELGPATQVLLFNATAASAEIVVATGWLKGESSSGTYRYDSPMVSATTKGGNVLVHVTDEESDVFVESGAASVSSGAQAPIASSAEKIYFTRRPGKPVATAGRPSQEFISAMPVSFRDVLPPRLSRFSAQRPPEPKSDHEVSYAEIERLLRLPPAWRKGLVDRFKPRLQDRGFRQAIEAHITALPEWKPLLSADHPISSAAPTDKSDPQ